MNDSKTVSVGMSEYFIPVKQEVYDTLMSQGPSEVFDRWNQCTEQEAPLYDPNYWSDPNDFPNLTLDTKTYDFMERHDPNRLRPLKLLIVEPGTSFSVKVIDFKDLLLMAMPCWLSDDPTLDLNDDGVVKFDDVIDLLSW